MPRQPHHCWCALPVHYSSAGARQSHLCLAMVNHRGNSGAMGPSVGTILSHSAPVSSYHLFFPFYPSALWVFIVVPPCMLCIVHSSRAAPSQQARGRMVQHPGPTFLSIFPFGPRTPAFYPALACRPLSPLASAEAGGTFFVLCTACCLHRDALYALFREKAA